MNMSRTILLRRPPVLRVTEEPFVPRVPALAEIDLCWEAMRRDVPAYFDGRLLHVFGVSRNGHGGATIHVVECAFRHFAVRSRGIETGVRPLGVKGIVISDDHVLVGLRSSRVSHAGLWEFAPGGAVEPGRLPLETLRNELEEETGLVLSPADRVTARVIFFDHVVGTWEIVHVVRLAGARPTLAATAEYDAFRWLRCDSPGGPLGHPISELDPLPMTSAALLMRRFVPGAAPRTGTISGAVAGHNAETDCATRLTWGRGPARG